MLHVTRTFCRYTSLEWTIKGRSTIMEYVLQQARVSRILLSQYVFCFIFPDVIGLFLWHRFSFYEEKNQKKSRRILFCIRFDFLVLSITPWHNLNQICRTMFSACIFQKTRKIITISSFSMFYSDEKQSTQLQNGGSYKRWIWWYGQLYISSYLQEIMGVITEK